MAEGFARTYGSDVLVPASAGLAPANNVAPDTIKAMKDKGIDLRDHFPKSIKQLGRSQFEIVVNMSGFSLPPLPGARLVEWDVEDPVAMNYEDHCGVRDEIERLVMRLVLDLRRDVQQPKFKGQGSGRFKL